MLAAYSVNAQCSFRNTAFKSGEFLSYNLYYNWKFVWVKVGTASMYTVQSRYNGKPAYRGSLTTRGNGRLDDFFLLRDTLLCYNSLDLEPLYFRKGAREGDRYTVDEVYYSYSGNKINLRQHRIHADGENSWKAGHIVKFPMADGKNNTNAQLLYQGKQTIKADNGHKYRCLKLAYQEQEDNGRYKSIVDFYVTDDSNHIPIRLDMYLRFGYAKAFLTNMKGIRSNIDSKIK